MLIIYLVFHRILEKTLGILMSGLEILDGVKRQEKRGEKKEAAGVLMNDRFSNRFSGLTVHDVNDGLDGDTKTFVSLLFSYYFS